VLVDGAPWDAAAGSTISALVPDRRVTRRFGLRFA
jgi:hypothetical protein